MGSLIGVCPSIPHHSKIRLTHLQLIITRLHLNLFTKPCEDFKLKMKHEELEPLASKLGGDFRSTEPLLRDLDKHLTLRTYLEGYALSDLEAKIWQTLRGNKALLGILRKGALANLSRWFSFIEQTHPEIQEEVKAAEAAHKAKVAASSKAGGSFNLALQDTDKGVVTRFLPEPS